jgi:hypothetical protein
MVRLRKANDIKDLATIRAWAMSKVCV